MIDPIYIPKPGDNYTILTLFRPISGSIVEVTVEELWSPSGITAWIAKHFEGWNWVRFHHYVYKYTKDGDEFYDVSPTQNNYGHNGRTLAEGDTP